MKQQKLRRTNAKRTNAPAHSNAAQAPRPILSRIGDWAQNLSPVSSLLFSVVAVVTSLGAFAVATWEREQDNQIGYMQMLEEKMYDAEIQDHSVICLFGLAYASVACDGHASLSKDNIVYAALTLDLLQASEEYRDRWCPSTGVWAAFQSLTNLNDCALYDDFREKVVADEMKVFANFAKAHFSGINWFEKAAAR